MQKQHEERIANLDSQGTAVSGTMFTTSYLCKKIRELSPDDTVFAIGAVTNSILVSDQICATKPGQSINCGVGALGIKLALDAREKEKKRMVVGSSVTTHFY